MPIEIDEIVLRIDVVNADSGGASPSGAAPAPQDAQALIAECVERVLQVLREREEP